MGRLIYPGSRQIEGPWLLDRSNLTSLESIVEEIAAEIKASEDVENTTQYIVLFKEGEKIVEDSISAADANINTRNKTPINLTVKILNERGTLPFLELVFYLKTRMLQSFSYDIRYLEDEETKCRIINKLENWIEENEPSRFLKLWNRASCYAPFIGYCALMVLLTLFIVQSDSSSAYQNALQPQIYSILEEGVNENNYKQAIELLLIKEYSYAPALYKANIPISSYLFFILVALVVAAIVYSPRGSVAIGAGKKMVKFWRRYITAITITIPTLIILPLLINFLGTLFP